MILELRAGWIRDGMALCLALSVLLPVRVEADPAERPAVVEQFLASNCYDCHEGESAEAGLDLAALSVDLHDEVGFAQWVRVQDRVQAGEMPPADWGSVDSGARGTFGESLGSWLESHQRRLFAAQGRVRGRRLTNVQLERTLHTLLGIDIPLARRLPEEPRPHIFATVAQGQPMSHFQLEGHMAVVDAALDEAFRRGLGAGDTWTRELDARTLSRRRAQSRTREPELIDSRAVIWSSGLAFYGRVPATTARESGWYRFVIRASALKSPSDHGVWCTVRSGPCVSSAPLLDWVGAFEALPEPGAWTFETWLPEGHMLEIRPGDTTLKKARFQGGQVGPGEGGPQNVPGVAMTSIQMERFHRGGDDDEIRKLLFGDLPVVLSARGEPARVTADRPAEAAARLIRIFARRAFRRPVTDEEVTSYVELAERTLRNGMDFVTALRAGYRALLCSPRFLYLVEQPGALDDHAIACRLSYLIGGDMPDDELSALADQSRLSDARVLHEQVERLLAKCGEAAFMRDLAAEWFDLRLMDATEPSRQLCPDFDLIVQQSMEEETYEFLASLLRENLSVAHLIDADYTFLNSRLARYYGIPGVEGDKLRRHRVDAATHRGGLLTQGAVLKVTANGTTTSPVVRGVWVSERLLGESIPAPPAGVPAIEPDIRGAKTIREMLAKHRSDDSCAACHRKIDPPGFALENFDPAGKWRDRYPLVAQGKRGQGALIDASFALPDGRSFDDVQQFQQLIAGEPAKLARNVAEKLLAYGTGAPVAFADREELERIAGTAAGDGYGLRSLLHAVVASPIFLHK